MRYTLASYLLLGLLAVPSCAGDEPAAKASKATDSFAALKKEYDEAKAKRAKDIQEALKAAQKAFQEAKTDEEKNEIQNQFAKSAKDNVSPKFAPRFLEFAENNPKDASRFDALALALQTSAGSEREKDSVWPKVVTILWGSYVTKPEIKRVVRRLARGTDEASDKLLRDIMARNADRKIQAAACKALIKRNENMAQGAEQLKSNDTLRKDVQQRMGNEFVDKLLANADKFKKETDEFNEVMKDKYTEFVPDLSIGKPAPEIVIENLEGKEAMLSGLKGKVVVLDIWATWCGPCRAMIPHEREMVSKLKDKPFVLVSISTDEEKKTLTDFLAKEKMPWTHWWSGPESALMEDYEVEHFPTIYVLDAKGIIRNKEIRGEELEKAVEKLLEEMGE
ncbi:MAG TPA: redoxin family protein, partial [Gemmataceae bacterium]|nr:redoxin family protein [Gemmataceae bacterium]